MQTIAQLKLRQIRTRLEAQEREAIRTMRSDTNDALPDGVLACLDCECQTRVPERHKGHRLVGRD